MIYGLPEKLCALREKSGLSQGDVAKRLSIAASNISGYESGDRPQACQLCWVCHMCIIAVLITCWVRSRRTRLALL